MGSVLPLLWCLLGGLQSWGVDRVLPLRSTLLRCFQAGVPEARSTATFRGGPLLENSRRGVCWRVGFPVCCSLLVVWCFPPLWCFPPWCAGAVPPCGLLTPRVALRFAFMGPPAEPSGVGTPNSGWQQSGRRECAAAARISTTSAETPAGTQASPQPQQMAIQCVRRLL